MNDISVIVVDLLEICFVSVGYGEKEIVQDVGKMALHPYAALFTDI